MHNLPKCRNLHIWLIYLYVKTTFDCTAKKLIKQDVSLNATCMKCAGSNENLW